MGRKRRHRRRNANALRDQTQGTAPPAPATAAPATVKPLVVRLASGDLDVAAIHGFLCVVAARAGALRCEVNAEKSMREVWRIVRAIDLAGPGETPYGLALMAQRGDRLVGTLGLVCAQWWYGDQRFFTDQWFFTLPEERDAGPALLADADALAQEAGLELLIHLRTRPKAIGSSLRYARFRR
jgi:hypothetical protein